MADTKRKTVGKSPVERRIAPTPEQKRAASVASKRIDRSLKQGTRITLDSFRAKVGW